MASKHGGLLVTLGKRILGFNTSSTGCCAAPSTTADTKAGNVDKADAARPGTKPLTLTADTTGGSCCAPTCCSAEAPADASQR